MSHVIQENTKIFVIKNKKMIINTEIPSAILHYISKIFTLELLPALLSVPLAISTPNIFKVIFEGTEHRDLYVIASVFFVCFMLFCFVFIVDFITGVKASKFIAKKQNRKSYVTSKRLWSSFWKVAAFFVISFPLFVFVFVFLILEMNTIKYILLSISVLFMMLATFVEIYSIGENLEKIYGNKPKYFAYFDKISNALESLFNKKIDKL